MKIRPAVASDVLALVRLNQSVHDMHAASVPEIFRQNPPEKVVADAFSSGLESVSSFWLIAEDDEPCGFLSAEFIDRPETWYMVHHRVCYLSCLVVASARRRRGIARALLAELKRESSSRGVARIELDAWAFNNEAKRAFVSLGFRTVKERMAL